MKLTQTLLAATLATLLAACGNGAQDQIAQTAQQGAEQVAEAAQDAASSVADAASDAVDAVKDAVAPQADEGATNWFGGPIYTGEPALAATAALVKAGGGAENFDFATALVAMLGEETVNAEVAKLTEQYGEENVNGFVAGMTWAIKDGLKRATEAGVALPEPADLEGAELAKALVQAGTAPDGKFWAGYLFDVAISHDLHNLVMADIDAEFGHAADENTHRILNQAMYDVAQALGMTDVGLADLH